MFEAVLFDVIGTTIKENNGDAILAAFEKAFLAHVNSINMQTIKRLRGKDKRIMIAEVLTLHGYPLHLTEPVYQSFRTSFEERLVNFSEMNGAADIFAWLKAGKIKVGIGTGLERDLFDQLYRRLDWTNHGFDYIGVSGEAGLSRPNPYMILDMMKKLGLRDKRRFLKVGDTAADIQEGKNAGVVTVAILSGSQPANDLKNENPDFIIESLSQIKNIIHTCTHSAESHSNGE